MALSPLSIGNLMIVTEAEQRGTEEKTMKNHQRGFYLLLKIIFKIYCFKCLLILKYYYDLLYLFFKEEG